MMSTYLFRVLQRKLWTVMIIALVAGAGAYYFLRDMQQKYKSTAQLSARFKTNDRVLTSNAAGLESKPSLQNHIEAMKTEFIGMMVSYNLLLHDLNEDIPFRGYGSAQLSPAEQRLTRIKLMEKLNTFETLSMYDKFENKLIGIIGQKKYEVAGWFNEGALRVEKVGDTNFIKVEFLSENPLLSAFVVNTLCSEYIRYNNYLNHDDKGDSLQFFFELAERKKKELEAKTEELNLTQSSGSSVQNPDNINGAKLAGYEIELREAGARVEELSVSLRIVKSKITDHESQLGKKENADPRSSPKVIDLQTKIDELNRIYVSKGSNDKKLEAIISNLMNELQSEMTRLEREFDKTDSRLEKLTAEKRKIELDFKRAESNLLTVRSNVHKLRRGKQKAGSQDVDVALQERARDSASKEYAAAVQKFERIKNRESQMKGDGAGLKLLVMGQPNAEPETLSVFTIVGIVMAIASVVVSVIIMIVTYIRIPPRPINPTFVITR